MLPALILTAAALAVPPCPVQMNLDALDTSDNPLDIIGLRQADIEQAMDQAMDRAHHCLPTDISVLGTLRVRVIASCTGTISSVKTVEESDVPPMIAECVLDSLQGASFPTHSLSDGFEFDYAMELWAWPSF